jgi:cytochrome c-type protein NapB
MMEKPKQDPKIGKVFLGFAAICILALPLVVFSAFSYESEEPAAATITPPTGDFDYRGGTIFENYDQISQAYLSGTSTERTLSEYYSRRQYLGSPPYIPHKVEKADNTRLQCLTCHAKGGWTTELKRNTPLTPHPEQTACRQCHVEMTTENLFVKNIWMSADPPRLGRSYLPGGPPPIPHALQMRGNCIACHVGPGAVNAIRVDHPSRGNCRQCHVTDAVSGLFQRKSDY